MAGEHAGADSRLSRRQRWAVMVLAVVCIVAVPVGLTAAQSGSGGVFNEGFEDSNWDSNWTVDQNNGQIDRVNERSREGSWSLRMIQSASSTGTSPEVTSETFAVPQGEAVETNVSVWWLNNRDTDNRFDVDYVIEGGNGSSVRIELASDPGDSLSPQCSWRLSGSMAENEYFCLSDQQWHDLSLEQSSDNSEWILESGGSEVARTNVTGSLDDRKNTTVSMYVSFMIDIAPDGQETRAYYDGIDVNGADSIAIPTDEDLDLDVPKYMNHGETSHYTVEYNDSGTWTDVTENATVTPDNTDAITFYPSNNTAVSTSNESINVRFDVTAEYDGLNDTDRMTVADNSVENLDILPTWWKVNATVGDGMMLWLIGATLFAIVATRMANSFAGIGAYTMLITAGWVSGPVSDGVLVATLLTGIFLGMNLALNIDTTVKGTG